MPCFTVGACLGAVGACFFPEPGVLGLKGSTVGACFFPEPGALGLKGGAVGARLRANVVGNGNEEHGERDSDTDHGDRFLAEPGHGTLSEADRDKLPNAAPAGNGVGVSRDLARSGTGGAELLARVEAPGSRG